MTPLVIAFLLGLIIGIPAGVVAAVARLRAWQQLVAEMDEEEVSNMDIDC